jgi:N6-adenosine-specific RNA methylase IME4
VSDRALRSAGTGLIRYDAARRALAEAHRIDEVKVVRNLAMAAQLYAKQAKDTDLITKATEIRMRAERRAGEILIEMAARKERAASKDTLARGREVATTGTPKLADLGINKTQSSRWQRLAALDSDAFEHKVGAASKRAYDTMTRRFLKAEKIRQAKERHAKTIEHGCTVTDLVALAESGYRAAVIYADPPWVYETWGPTAGVHSTAANHYGTQAIDEIAALPVEALAADDCALLLWCIGPHIAKGTHTKIIEAWGFVPSAVEFVWIKTNADGSLFTGMGHSTRSNGEYVILATKGSPLRLAADVHQVVMAPVGEHSEKPEEVRRRIERLFPGPYLELYGRKPALRWTVWGNEIPRDKFSVAAELSAPPNFTPTQRAAT